MGNTGWRRSKNDAVATEVAASRRAVARSRKQWRSDAADDEEEEQTTRAAARRDRASRDGGAGAGAVVTVRVVMRRKDAEALAARLHARSARARKARMAELKGELRAGGDGCGGGGASPAPASRWSPQLAPIKES